VSTSRKALYDAGRKITEVEYGVSYPDGTVEWYGDGTFRSLDSVGGRRRFLEDRADRLKGLGLRDPGVVFLSRVKTTKFSTPETVCDEERRTAGGHR